MVRALPTCRRPVGLGGRRTTGLVTKRTIRRRYDAAMHFGGHLSTAGGLDTAVGRAQDLHATALQIFTQSPRMWKHPDPNPEVCARFRERRSQARLASVVCHATYLINLGTTDRVIRRKSIQALSDTLATAHMIDADGVVFHLGSHLGKGFGRALPRTVRAIETVLGRCAQRHPHPAPDRELGGHRRHHGSHPR